MKFRLIYKKLGVKSTDIFSEFEYSSDIRDICFVKDIGFLCLSANSLVSVTSEKCSNVLTIDNPMSICHGPLNNVYILYSGGIKSVNCSDNYRGSDILSLSQYNIIFRPLSKAGIHNMSIDSYENVIGISIPYINKVHKIRKLSIEKTFGTGIPEFGLASNLSYSSFCNPQGVLVYDSNTIFISDTGNGCIRSFNENHRIIVGNPLFPSIAPTKLLLDRKKDILYYLSKNYLKSISVGGGKDALLYESDKIISMALTDDGKIYLLEGEK